MHTPHTPGLGMTQTLALQQLAPGTQAVTCSSALATGIVPLTCLTDAGPSWQLLKNS